MVGVPRSKGCRICVQRRVKCDQTRPTCNNCKKGNRPCPGYNQDLKFQDEGARLRRRFQKAGSPTAGTESSRDSTDSPPESNTGSSSQSETWNGSPAKDNSNNDDVAKKSSSDVKRHWDVVGLDVEKSQRLTLLGLLEGKSEAYTAIGEFVADVNQGTHMNFGHLFDAPNQNDFLFKAYWGATGNSVYNHVISPDLVQNQLITTFKQSLYPDNNSIPQYLKHHARWLAHLPPLTGTNPLLDAAVCAVTLVHIGRLRNSEAFVVESRPYYGKALRLLNKALKDRVQGMQVETMCAVILLSFYEMFASENNESWIRHAGGVSALMRARGPDRHRHGLDREIFLAYRYMLIVESFQEDVPCFLAEPQWLKLSSTIHDDLTSAGVASDRAEIFDLAEDFYQTMVIIPAQSCDARAMWAARQNGTRPPCSRVELIERMNKSRFEFKSTFSRFETALKKIGHSPTLRLNSRDPLIGIEFEFVNTFASSTYTGYWTVLIVLNLCLQALQADDKEIVEMYKTESRDCALNICRSTAYMLTSSFLGPFFLIFGLRCGLLVYEDTDGPEADWILRKLLEIGDRHLGIAKHVPGYKPGITADELIAEFRARKAASKQNNNVAEEMDFVRQVTHGRGPAHGYPEDDNAAEYTETTEWSTDNNNPHTNGTTQSREKVTFRDMMSDNQWRTFDHTEDVENTWRDQQNFSLPVHEMNSLNVSPAPMTSGSNLNSAQHSTRNSVSPVPTPIPMPSQNDILTEQQRHFEQQDIDATVLADMESWDPNVNTNFNSNFDSNLDANMNINININSDSDWDFFSTNSAPTLEYNRMVRDSQGRSYVNGMNTTTAATGPQHSSNDNNTNVNGGVAINGTNKIPRYTRTSDTNVGMERYFEQ